MTPALYRMTCGCCGRAPALPALLTAFRCHAPCCRHLYANTHSAHLRLLLPVLARAIKLLPYLCLPTSRHYAHRACASAPFLLLPSGCLLGGALPSPAAFLCRGATWAAAYTLEGGGRTAADAARAAFSGRQFYHTFKRYLLRLLRAATYVCLLLVFTSSCTASPSSCCRTATTCLP